MTSRAARTALALAVLAGLALVFWTHRVHGDRPDVLGFFGSDLVRYHYPNTAYLHRELGAGRLPLWNPYQLAGEPILALHMPGVLYPPHLLVLPWLGPPRALEVLTLFHLIVAGFFTWLLAGRLGLGPTARLVSAVAYMLSTPLLMGVYMLAYLSTQAWLPAILWALSGLVAEARARWSLALAAALALAFLGGHAQGFVQEVQVAAAWGLFGLFAFTPRGARLRVTGLAALAGALALGLVAPQLLPTWELARQAVRGFQGITLRIAQTPHVPPEWFLRGLFDVFPVTIAGGPRGLYRWLASLPVLGLPLVACGLLGRRRRGPWLFFLAVAIVVALLMLGPYGPLYRLYHALPGGNLFRGPSRLAFLFACATALLMGLGVQGVVDTLGRRRPRAAAVAGTVLLAAVTADLYRRTALPDLHPAVAATPLGAPPALVDHLRALPGLPRTFIENAGVLYRPGLLYKFGMMDGLFVVPDYEPLMPSAYQRYLGVRRREPWHGRVSVLANPWRPRPPEALGRLLDLMGVRYYAADLALGPAGLRDLERFAGGTASTVGGVRLVERPRALPRAYAVRCARAVPDVPAALARVAAPAFRPREEAVLVAPDPPAGLPAACDAPGAAEDAVDVVSYAPHEVVLRSRCAAACLVVLTDLFYPGWHASVDGRPAPIHEVNALFRGVLVPPGTHEVVQRFAPGSFRAGVAACAVALLAGLGVAVLGRRGRD